MYEFIFSVTTMTGMKIAQKKIGPHADLVDFGIPGSNVVLLHLSIPGQSCERDFDRLRGWPLDDRSVIATPGPRREDD